MSQTNHDTSTVRAVADEIVGWFDGKPRSEAVGGRRRGRRVAAGDPHPSGGCRRHRERLQGGLPGRARDHVVISHRRTEASAYSSGSAARSREGEHRFAKESPSSRPIRPVSSAESSCHCTSKRWCCRASFSVLLIDSTSGRSTAARTPSRASGRPRTRPGLQPGVGRRGHG